MKKWQTVFRNIALLLLIVFSIYFIWIRIPKLPSNVLTEESPIVLSVSFHNSGEKGTFKYYPKENRMEKISDQIFYYLSLNDDRTKAIGIIKNEKNREIAELDLKSGIISTFITEIDMKLPDVQYSIKPYINLFDKIRNPQYYRNGIVYLLLNTINYVYKKDGEWVTKQLHESSSIIEDFEIMTIEGEDFIVIEKSDYDENKDQAYTQISKVNIGTENERELFKLYEKKWNDHDGAIDFNKSAMELLFYGAKGISVYQINNDTMKYRKNHSLWNSYVLDIQSSSNGKFIFYAAGRPSSTDGSNSYTYYFYLIDIQSNKKYWLTTWDGFDRFYGFDW